MLTSVRFLWFLFLVLSVSIAHRVNDSFIALYLKELGAPETFIGWSWLLAAASEIPVFFLLGRYGGRCKPLLLLSLAALFYTLRFYLMSAIQEPFGIALIQLLHGLSYGIFLLTALSYIQELVPDEFRATRQSVFTVVWAGLAGLIGGIAGGYIFSHLGYVPLYRISSILALCAASGFLGTQLYTDWKKTRTVSHIKAYYDHDM
ncbi:MFS transporter [Paenibacillus sp. GD4]|uniref:MFS transporter n=1 Tax=Paenibacillus sp. GD4 TaxID=3068890 RepID=UPI0027964ED5|nr:MFS transporter [Paenibacillus sp. GD4]MDQ1913587.1 MFS transporter [Paenibacillus sp. GD4]